MPTKAEILAWIKAHPQILEFDSSAVERFDEAAMRRAFGVTKMPELLTDGMAIDRAIREAFAAESPGQPIQGSVRVEIDIDATGHVTRVAAVDPPPLPAGVDGIVAIAIGGQNNVIDVTDGEHMNASPALNRATVKVLESLARFQPAELDKRPVPLRNWVMSFHFD